MSIAVPDGAVCATHADARAQWTCPRCGNFMCVACERRVRVDALPMCPACWELRAIKVPEQKSSMTGLQTAALVLGCIAILPIPLVQIASLVLGIVALVKARQGPARAVRWKPILGLCLTGVGLMWWVLIFGLALFK
jgi:hypothetical protein